MQKSTLMVDDDEARRRDLVHSFARRGLRYLDVPDAFGAMAALGRADFGAVVAAEGRRTLSLRGLCQLARRRHPDVHIVVLHREGSDPAQIPEILGVTVECIPAATSPEEVARLVEERLSGPPLEVSVDFDAIPVTAEAAAVDDDPTQQIASVPTEAAAALDAPDDAAHDSAASQRAADEETARDGPTSDGPTEPGPGELALALDRRDTQKMPGIGLPLPEAQPLLEGLLEEGAGPSLLMGIFSAELTGRLIIKDGAASRILYFYRGEPVWADDPLGDQGLHRRLVQRGHLPPDAQIDAVAPGQLLGALVQSGRLTGQAMHDFMRDVVREGALAVITASSGSYRFEEDKHFLDVAPLLRVNPFGLILESRRTTITPAQLLTMANEMAALFAIPALGLGRAQEKLAPFARGARLESIIDGTKVVSRVLEDAALDPFMGTLVMIALRDSKLVSLEPEPRTRDGGVILGGSFGVRHTEEITLVDAEPPPASTEDEARARERIFALYMKLKPLTVPRQVLGVDLDADLDAVERAFNHRMAELDPAHIPEGSAQQMLSSRVDELRKKVTHAYQAVCLQLSAGQTGLHALPGDPKANPFG